MKILKSVMSTLAGLLFISVVSVGSCYAQEHSHGEEGEECGKHYTITETHKELRKGVELTLSYDKASESFTGIIKNVSSEVAENVRVEGHLSNGVELGPTKPVNLKPGEEQKVKLAVKGQKFEYWTTHAEVGNSEHGHGEEGEHDHEGEGLHEHEGEESGE